MRTLRIDSHSEIVECVRAGVNYWNRDRELPRLSCDYISERVLGRVGFGIPVSELVDLVIKEIRAAALIAPLSDIEMETGL